MYLKRQRAKSAFSVAEVLISVSLLAFFVLLGFRLTDRKFAGAQSEAAANKVRDTLNLTRSWARAQGEPVGLAFRSNSGFASQSIYLIRGTESLRIWKSEDWGSEFPEAWASWGATSGDSVQEVPSSGPFDLAEIGGVPLEDPFVLFLPNGQYLIRGFPFDGSEYQIRVGANPTGSGSSDPSTATLAGMDHVWAIGIQPSGATSLNRETGLPPGVPSDLARVNAKPVSEAVTQIPVVKAIKPFPDLIETSPGVYSHESSEPIILNASAESPEGVQLFARWEADGGFFSLEDEWLPMIYSKTDGVWKASNTWQLPPNHDPTADPSFEVSLKVKDAFGNFALDLDDASIEFEIPQDGFQVYFTYDEDIFDSADTKNFEIINSDGSGRTVLRTVPHFHKFFASPDSSLLAMQDDHITNGPEISFLARDGTTLHTTTVPYKTFILGWREDSTAVFSHAANYHSDPRRVYEVKADGSPAQLIATLPVGSHVQDVSADGRYILYLGPVSGTDRDLVLRDRSDSSESILYSGPSINKGTISPNNDYIGFSADSRLHRIRLDGSDDLDLGVGWRIVFSPDGSKMALVDHHVSGAVFRVADIAGNVLFDKPGAEKTNVAWSPDSKMIITSKDGRGKGGVSLIDQGGAEAILVEEPPITSLHEWENFNGVTAE